jgi:hypothetical protein
MRKISLDIKTIVIFICVLLKYLIEYKVNKYILYSTVVVILFFQFLRILKNLKGNKVIIKSVVFLVFSIISTIIYKDVNFLITFVLALTLINCDVKDFVKKFMISSSIMYIMTILLYFLGVLNDNYLIRTTSNGYIIRHSLGFTHPNSIFMFYIPIVLCAYLLENNKKKFYVIFTILSLVLYKLSLSRTGIYCIILLFILDIFKKKINYKKIISWLPLMFFAASYFIAIKYGNSKSDAINVLFSNRPYLWNRIIENANMFTVFGSNVLSDLYLDNFYLAMVYRCGLYSTLLYYFILIFGMKNINNNKVYVSVLIFMIYGLAESNTLIGSINFTLAFLLYSIIGNKFEFGGQISDRE